MLLALVELLIGPSSVNVLLPTVNLLFDPPKVNVPTTDMLPNKVFVELVMVRLPYFSPVVSTAIFCAKIPVYSTVLVAPTLWVAKLLGKVPLPAIRSVAPLVIFNVPPLDVLLAVKVLMLKIPALMVKSLSIPIAPLTSFNPLPDMIKVP